MNRSVQDGRGNDRQVRGTPNVRQPLAAQIVDAFDLSGAEFGRLFGVSDQVASAWLAGDVPRQQRAKATVVVEMVDILSRELKPDHLPGVVRRPADVYGGRTVLDMIAADRHEELLELTRVSYDFGHKG